MENIQKFVSPVSVAIIIASIFASVVGYKYVNTLEKENVSSTYNKDENTLSVKGKAEKTVNLDTVWATFEVASVNLEGKNLTKENRDLYDKKLAEITDKLKSFGLDAKDTVIEITDATDYTVEETDVKPVVTKPVSKKTVEVPTVAAGAEYDYSSSYEDYGYESSYNSDTTKDKKVFSVIFSAPITKLTKDQIETALKELNATKVDIYNSLSRKGYDDLNNELVEKAIKNAVEKAEGKAAAFGKKAVPQNNYYSEYDMSASIVNATSIKYYVDNSYTFRLE